MARGSANHASSPAVTSLPKVQYSISKDEVLKLPGGVHDQQARTYGYNDFSEFRRPDHYIRHIEPLESDLAKTVEYDMDEQDQEWLDAVNNDRRKEQIDRVSCEVFEIIMDRLEKEWFDLTKNIPKPDFAMPSEDSTCAICDDSEGENSNAIVFCDGCNLAVHQDCYGVPYIPEGQWLCRKCTVSPENPVACMLCPNEGGAFKQTVHGEWVHLLCAIWIPETRVANDVFMEPVTGADRISKQRWKLRCSICDIRAGACIQCTKPSCFVAFHATCARKEKLLMPMKSAQGAEPASLTCFCDKHLPQEQQDARAAALEAEERHERTAPNTQLQSKSARAYAKTYKPGPPLVPALIVDRIMAYTYRIKIRKRQDFIHQVCRYWSLKREARRGAPLLKRLHLEPWTANAGTKVLSQEERLMRLDQLQRLRQDLINVRELTDLCRKRETRKLRQTEVIYEVLSQALFPHLGPLRIALERIMAFDRQDHFKNPVSRHDVPDYFDVIKKPMCWSVIDSKLDQHQYWDLQEFLDDIDLVLDNALLYNKSGSIFQKSATRIKKDSRAILADLERLRFHHAPLPPQPNENVSRPANAQEEEEEEEEEKHDPPRPPIGDLEPHLDILDLLHSSDAIKEDLNIELDDGPISSLFSYSFARVKPPPPDSLPTTTTNTTTTTLQQPPVPRPPRVRKGKPKRDRKAEAERARANREAREAAATAEGVSVAGAQEEKEEEEIVKEKEKDTEREGEKEKKEKEIESEREKTNERDRDREVQVALDASAGFRAPRTRGALAAAAAFEAEACGLSTPSPAAGPSVPPESASSDSAKPVSKSKKRASVAPIGQPIVPRVVSAVDNRDSFSMFNAGWILPPDQKRGGRAPTERQALPPPRKKQKTDHPNSRLSVVSTAASDNQTLRRTPVWSSDTPEVKHHPDESLEVAMDVDIPSDAHGEASGSRQHETQSASRAVSLSDLDDIEAPHNVVTQPNGVVIIEKLDTPAIRREKSMRRKAEKKRQAAREAEAEASVSAGSSSLSIQKEPTPPPPPPRSVSPTPAVHHVEDSEKKPGQDDDYDESELSELSEESEEPDGASEEEEERPPPKTPGKRTKSTTKPKKSRRAARLEQFDDYTIVWAKSDSYPWWPAVVYADTNSNVPKNILEGHKEKRQKRKIKLFIVQYYDKQKSWQSVPRDKLKLLGEDSKLDEQMLSSGQQKWKSSASKKECRDAYRQALADMDGSANTGQSRAGEGSDAES